MGDDETKALRDLEGMIFTCKIRVLRAARNFAKVMTEAPGTDRGTGRGLRRSAAI
jgi:hypothetical protein